VSVEARSILVLRQDEWVERRAAELAAQSRQAAA
jgi:hypothetical protein